MQEKGRGVNKICTYLFVTVNKLISLLFSQELSAVLELAASGVLVLLGIRSARPSHISLTLSLRPFFLASGLFPHEYHSPSYSGG